MTTHTTPDDQPLTPTPDTTRDLTELWDAMGDAGIKNPIRMRNGQWVFQGQDIPEDECGFILTGHAERWLQGRGWEVAEPYGDGCWERSYIYYLRHHPPKWISGDSLPAAIRAECGRVK